ncbi:MAG: hypothetical protein VKO64_04490 [Candidatus Sericytochromatia bacterium]|nr:hypothetical protein [Candidatus Sericytochromatia bacterium]
MNAEHAEEPSGQDPPKRDVDAFPALRRAVFDLEWKVRREASQTADRMAELLQEVLLTTAWGAASMADGLSPVLVDLRDRLAALEELAHGPEGLAHETVQRLGARIDQAESLAAEAIGMRPEIEQGMADALVPLLQAAEATAVDRETLGRVVAVLGSIEDEETGLPALMRAVAAVEAENARREEALRTLANETGASVLRMEDKLARWETTLQGAKDVLVTLPEKLEQLAAVHARLEALEVADRHRGEVIARLDARLQDWSTSMDQRVTGLLDLVTDLRDDVDDSVRSAQLAALTAGLGQQQVGLKELRDTFQTWRLAQDALQSAAAAPLGQDEAIAKVQTEARQQITRLAKRLEAIERHLASGSGGRAAPKP